MGLGERAGEEARLGEQAWGSGAEEHWVEGVGWMVVELS